MNLKEDFINLYESNIKREDSKKLLEWLKTTDFFEAPASTKFHCACEQGLLMHSLNVYKSLINRFYDSSKDSLESFTIISLLHDICKINYYKLSKRNVKNEITGIWEQVPFYTIEDAFPYGHGEKSVFLIERFMKLKTHEAAAIRWHMGGFDDTVKSGSFSIGLAFDKFPLSVKLHIADLEATYLYEKNTSSVKI